MYSVVMNHPLVPELYCSDLNKSLDFYCRVLGFSITYERPEAKFAYLERQGTALMIEELNDTDRKWRSGTLEKPFGRGVNFQITTDHIDDLYETIRKAGLPFFMEIEEKWYRRSTDTVCNKQFVVADPDGYLLRFSETIGTRPSV